MPVTWPGPGGRLDGAGAVPRRGASPGWASRCRPKRWQALRHVTPRPARAKRDGRHARTPRGQEAGTRAAQGLERHAAATVMMMVLPGAIATTLVARPRNLTPLRQPQTVLSGLAWPLASKGIEKCVALPADTGCTAPTAAAGTATRAPTAMSTGSRKRGRLRCVLTIVISYLRMTIRHLSSGSLMTHQKVGGWLIGFILVFLRQVILERWRGWHFDGGHAGFDAGARPQRRSQRAGCLRPAGRGIKPGPGRDRWRMPYLPVPCRMRTQYLVLELLGETRGAVQVKR